MDEFKKEMRCGPGGFKCPCCGPAPGKKRKQLRRLTRHRIENKVKKIISDELKEYSNK